VPQEQQPIVGQPLRGEAADPLFARPTLHA
jgi:hypothetical protein